MFCMRYLEAPAAVPLLAGSRQRAASVSWVLRDVLGCRDGKRSRVLRHNEPGHQVGNEPDTGAERDGEPEDSDEYGIYIEVAGETGADACDFLVLHVAREIVRSGARGRGGAGGVTALTTEAVLVLQRDAALGAEHRPPG